MDPIRTEAEIRAQGVTEPCDMDCLHCKPCGNPDYMRHDEGCPVEAALAQ